MTALSGFFQVAGRCGIGFLGTYSKGDLSFRWLFLVAGWIWIPSKFIFLFAITFATRIQMSLLQRTTGGDTLFFIFAVAVVPFVAKTSYRFAAGVITGFLTSDVFTVGLRPLFRKTFLNSLDWSSWSGMLASLCGSVEGLWEPARWAVVTHSLSLSAI